MIVKNIIKEITLNYFFTSDTHFSHTNIIKHCNRPFKSADEMNSTIIYNWNKKVKKDDIVFHLGDFSLSHKITSYLINKLNGKIHLIAGNHDRKKYYIKNNTFYSVNDILEINLENKLIVLCHYPFLTWNRSHHGSWNLHGHVHDRELKIKDCKFRLNVGVDVNDFTPISFNEVRQKMELIK